MRWTAVRTLEGRDLDAVLRLCERDQVANVFVASLLESASGRPRRLGGEFWGWFERGRLRSACWAGANLVPVEATPVAIEAFAQQARSQGRRCNSIVGPADAVLPLWELLEPVWGPARDIRPHQPLMRIDGPPLASPDPLVRRTVPEDLETLLPACVAMYTEEVGYSPTLGDGGAAYRARLIDLVRQGRSMARIEQGPSGPEVVFKAETGALTRTVAQVQGVWVTPSRRGQGLSEPGMAAVVELARQSAPTVSLYVNDYNKPAVAAYRRVGFREVGSFATVHLL